MESNHSRLKRKTTVTSGDLMLRGAAMGSLRAFFRDHRRLAILFVAMALVMKALLPAGYMIGQQSPHVLTIQVCTDAQGAKLTHTIELPRSGDAGKDSDKHAKASDTCAFSSLTMGSTSAADVTLLAAALAFILALGFRSARSPKLQRVFYLRPPLRGPPALL